MPTSTPPHSRRVSFSRQPSVNEVRSLAAGEAREPGDTANHRRASHDSATTTGAPVTPAPSTASGPLGTAARESAHGPSRRLSQMPAPQMATVLRDVLHTLGKSSDHVAIRLLLSDLGRDMEALVPDDASLDMAYAALNDAILCAEGRHGPHQGDYRRPNAVSRFFLKLCGRQI